MMHYLKVCFCSVCCATNSADANMTPTSLYQRETHFSICVMTTGGMSNTGAGRTTLVNAVSNTACAEKQAEIKEYTAMQSMDVADTVTIPIGTKSKTT